MNGWIGFDLDATLAQYHGFRGAMHIGDPIPEMIALVKQYRSQGIAVKIFTARISHDGTPGRQRDAAQALLAIQEWCFKHIGEYLPVTNEKNYQMWKCYDDRAIQVEANTGRIIGEEQAKLQ